MCGLVGCVGKVTRKEEDAFQLLLGLDTIRGPHSTGVAFIHHKEEPIIAKAVGTPWDLFGTDDYKKGMAKGNAALIGHNRFATKGAINADNAHPFQHGEIIGAHNGTLRRQSLLLHYKEFEVDSDNIFYDMNISGHVSTIKRLDGAFALSWYDERDQRIHLCRNDERPLFYVFSKDSKTVFWASEYWMLSVALGRVGIEHHEIAQLGVGEHVAFDIPMCYPSQVVAYQEFQKEKLELCPEWQWQGYNYKGGGSNSGNASKAANDSGTKAGEKATGQSNSGTGGSAQSLPKDANFRDVLQQYIKKGTVEFFIAEEVRKPTTGNKTPYIKCYTQDKYGVEVRIFQEPGSPIWNKCAKSVDWFRAKVKTTTQLGERSGYITIDYRSLVDVDYDNLSVEGKAAYRADETPYKGFNDMPLTAHQYMEITNEGCCICDDIASYKDHKVISWISPNLYLCKTCSSVEGFVEEVKKEYAKDPTGFFKMATQQALALQSPTSRTLN